MNMKPFSPIDIYPISQKSTALIFKVETWQHASLIPSYSIPVSRQICGPNLEGLGPSLNCFGFAKGRISSLVVIHDQEKYVQYAE